MLSPTGHTDDDDQSILATTYGSRYLDEPVPRLQLPAHQMPAEAAYQIVHDELALDGNPTLNLASFVTTWMEPAADRLMTETLAKNYIDQDEYPQTTEIQHRCVNMLARLFGASHHRDGTGTATVGSSEAIHLAGLAMKWRWRRRCQKEGRPSSAPNIVMGQNVQVCWEKFARYFDVEPRCVPMTQERYVIGVPEAMELVDESTIGVVGILGSTYTGEFEPIAELDAALTELNARTGWDVPLHVDAASGGFVAPFIDPDLAWDFRLDNVRSINVSGHKYGLVYPGVGWVLWRQAADLPEDLVFHVNYLGGDQPTFNLNFSRGAGQILAQYYNFLRLGFEGYREIMIGLRRTARALSSAIVQTGHFESVGAGDGLPVVCVRLKGSRPYTVFDVSRLLRSRGWIVPAYTLAPNAEDIAVLRVVVREGFSRDLADLLVSHLVEAVRTLDGVAASKEGEVPTRPSAREGRGSRRKTTGVC